LCSFSGCPNGGSWAAANDAHKTKIDPARAQVFIVSSWLLNVNGPDG
jgi:hypothetical protein